MKCYALLYSGTHHGDVKTGRKDEEEERMPKAFSAVRDGRVVNMLHCAALRNTWQNQLSKCFLSVWTDDTCVNYLRTGYRARRRAGYRAGIRAGHCAGLSCRFPVGLSCQIPVGLSCRIPVGLSCGIHVGLSCGIPVGMSCRIPVGLSCGIPVGLSCRIPVGLS